MEKGVGIKDLNMINNYPQVSFVYNRRKTAGSSRKAAVELRITYEGKQKFISTGIMLYPNQWRKGCIVNCSDAIQISKVLDKKLSQVREVLLEMIEDGGIDLSSVPERLRMKIQGKVSFLSFCEQRAEVRKYRKRKDSQERYDRFLRLFREWGGIKGFRDITEASIIEYDLFLKSKGMKPYSKWQNYHRFLNSFIIDAIDAGYLRKNPYRWVNIEKEKSLGGLGKYLTPEEFKSIKEGRMPTEGLERARDVFVFQTYTCLSYTDLKGFDAKLIQEVKGMKVYIGARQKTGHSFTIPILPPAWNILEKYNMKLPVVNNVKYNLFLKGVAQSVGIDKPVSSHWARHTGATLLLNEGVDMKVVAKICGHSSTRITEQVYAKLLDETVVEALHKIEI